MWHPVLVHLGSCLVSKEKFPTFGKRAGVCRSKSCSTLQGLLLVRFSRPWKSWCRALLGGILMVFFEVSLGAQSNLRSRLDSHELFPTSKKNQSPSPWVGEMQWVQTAFLSSQWAKYGEQQTSPLRSYQFFRLGVKNLDSSSDSPFFSNSAESKTGSPLGSSDPAQVFDKASEATTSTDTSLRFRYEAHGIVSPQSSALNSLDLRQAYLGVGSKISIGRRIWTWSELDEDFQLGLFQPRSLLDPLSSRTQGLTGLFVQHRLTDTLIPAEVGAFASVLHLPDQQAPFEIKEGRIESQNPWVPRLPSKASVNGRSSVDLKYQVIMPDVSEVVMQPGFAAYMKLSKSSEMLGEWRLSWASKASHQLAVGVSAVGSSRNSIDIPVRPQVYRHQIVALDGAKDLGEFVRLSTSVVREKPEEIPFHSQWTYSQYGESWLLAPALTLRNSWIQVKWSHLFIQESEPQVKGPLAQEMGDFLLPRYGQVPGHRLELATRYSWKKAQSLLWRTELRVDGPASYEFWNHEVMYQWDNRWSAFLAGRWVWIDSNRFTSKTKTYSTYENHDDVQVGVSYVF